MKMKAQAALEFMLFFGFFATVFLLVSTTLLQSEMARVGRSQGELVKETCLGLRDEINTAISMGDGYWNTVELKRRMGDGYSARIRDGTVSVRYGDKTSEFFYVATLADNRIEGLSSDSEGMILDVSKDNVVVRNKGGVIVLEQ
jgi:hypothetical protein